jgi:hypothetical protein
MSTESCCSAGVRIFSDWIIPEGCLHRHLGDFYRNNPIMSRLVVTPLALLSGIVKVFLFPLMCAVGIAAMPMIALLRALQGKKDGGGWLQAWCFSILGVTASVAFMGLSCYYLPLVASSFILVTLITLSVIIHIQKLVKEPEEPPPFEKYHTIKIV